jgi:hypothetical protein
MYVCPCCRSAFLLDFPAASQPPASPSSVMAKIKPSVVYASGGSATQTIDYTLDLASNNGILARPPTLGVADVNEGQLLLNMDQMVGKICSNITPLKSPRAP